MKQGVCEELASAETLEEAVRDSDEWVFVHDYKRILWVSSSLCKYLGYSGEEMEGTLLIKFIAASGYVGLIQAISRNRLAKLRGDANEFHVTPTRVKHKNGQTVCLQARCSADVDVSLLSNVSKARLTVVEALEDYSAG